MPSKVSRVTIDLSPYPDLVVMPGMRVNTLRGIKTLFQFGPRISASGASKPDGLLLHEYLTFSFLPLHVGMRQYWRDFESLEAWARSMPHQQWWQNFVRDSGGTGFWHETYFLKGGMEAIYDDVPKPVGLMQFAPQVQARGRCFSRENEPASRANLASRRPWSTIRFDVEPNRFMWSVALGGVEKPETDDKNRSSVPPPVETMPSS